VNTVLLAGRDFADVGAVGEAAADRIAVALSRGGAEKRYEYTDPNEDVALAASGRHGVLVAVADGHWGSRAAEIAVAQLRDGHAVEFLDGEARTFRLTRSRARRSPSPSRARARTCSCSPPPATRISSWPARRK
jgi:hypothetical protein